MLIVETNVEIGQVEPPCDGVVGLAVMAGLSPGGKVRENQMFSLSPTGVVFHGEMSRERWTELMRMLRQWKNVGTVWLADAISHGRHRFGQQVVEETLKQMEFDLMDAERAIGIGTLADGVRNARLTSEHYWVLAKAELPEDAQRKWAEVAAERGLSALALGRSIEAGRVLDGSESSAGGHSGKGAGFVTIQGVRQLFDTWWKRVDKTDPIKDWPMERKRELWEELKAPVQVGIQLARDLGIPVPGEGGGK